jgi:hypothetical protein
MQPCDDGFANLGYGGRFWNKDSADQVCIVEEDPSAGWPCDNISKVLIWGYKTLWLGKQARCDGWLGPFIHAEAGMGCAVCDKSSVDRHVALRFSRPILDNLKPVHNFFGKKAFCKRLEI